MQPQRPLELACNADGASFAIGQPTSPQLESAAAYRAGALMARSLRPGEMVTKEFDGARLNLDVDARGRVTAVRCG
ncbi:MAG: I78 family peptidase inhibitor [Variovorax sp.]